MRRLGKLVLVAGCTCSAASVLYWYWFYENVMRALGERGSPPTECLLTLKGPCGLIAGAARFLGYASYDPHFLWAGLLASGVGITLILLSSPEKTETSAAANRREPQL
jgi:hypothetical protein